MKLSVILATLCLLLGIVVALELTTGSSKPPGGLSSDGGAKGRLEKTEPPRIDPPGLDRFSEMTQRPLFFPSRRPQARDKVAQIAGRPKLPDLRLRGVTITSSGKTALLSRAREATYLQVTEGQNVEGWTVKSIRSDGIVLVWGQSEETIELKNEIPPKAKKSRNPVKKAPRPPP